MNPRENKGAVTKVLAVAGAALAWFPILATVLTSVAGSLMSGVFRCDYLMPAELFPSALVGGALLLWAALRARSHRRLIGWSYAVEVGLLVGGQAFAVANGSLSSTPEAGPAAWIMAVLIGSVAGYTLALLVTAAGAVLLLLDVFRRPEGGGLPAVPAR